VTGVAGSHIQQKLKYCYLYYVKANLMFVVAVADSTDLEGNIEIT
jgi:hypothetical protein